MSFYQTLHTIVDNKLYYRFNILLKDTTKSDSILIPSPINNQAHPNNINRLGVLKALKNLTFSSIWNLNIDFRASIDSFNKNNNYYLNTNLIKTPFSISLLRGLPLKLKLKSELIIDNERLIKSKSNLFKRLADSDLNIITLLDSTTPFNPQTLTKLTTSGILKHNTFINISIYSIFDINYLKRERLYTKLKYSRSPAYDIVSGGAAAFLAAFIGFLVSEKFGIELVDSGDFYIAFMYGVFLALALKPFMRFLQNSSNFTGFFFNNLKLLMVNYFRLSKLLIVKFKLNFFLVKLIIKLFIIYYFISLLPLSL